MIAKFIEYVPFDNMDICIQFGIMFECPYCLKQIWLTPDQLELSTGGKCQYCLGEIKIDKTKIPHLSIEKQSELIHEYHDGEYKRYYDGKYCYLIQRTKKEIK